MLYAIGVGKVEASEMKGRRHLKFSKGGDAGGSNKSNWLWFIMSALPFFIAVAGMGSAGIIKNIFSGDDYYKNLLQSYVLSQDLKNSAAGIPVLVYHCISDNVSGSEYLFVSPSAFNEQMGYLKKAGYTAITFRDIRAAGTDGAQHFVKPVIITFDDGYEDNCLNAYPILKKYGFKATIFLISDMIGKYEHINKKQIVEMSDIIDFQCHSATHPDLTKLSGKDLEYEVYDSGRKICSITGRDVFVFAYPYGLFNSTVTDAVAKYYMYAVTCRCGFFDTGIRDPQSYYTINRIIVPHGASIESFQKTVSGT